MPALPAVPKVLKVVQMISDQSDIRSGNRAFFQYSGTAPTGTEVLAFATSAITAWDARFGALYDQHSNFESCTVTDLSSNISPEETATSATSGTRAGLSTAAGTSINVDFSILRRYRGGHPKVFLSAGVAADLNTRQLWGATFAGLIQTAWINYVSDLAAAIWAGGGILSQVNVSYFQGFTNHTYPSGRTRPIPTLRVTPVVDEVSLITVSTKVGSQRRRNLQSA